MWAARISGFVILTLGVSGSLNAAEPPKGTARVIVDKANLHAGPAWSFEPTGALRRGQQVTVHHQDGQMMAVVPPEGSVNWVSHLFLGGEGFQRDAETRQNAVVTSNCHMRVGYSPDDPRVTNVKRNLPKGTIVEILGGKKRFEVDGVFTWWYPIKPPEGDYRYVPNSNLSKIEPLASPPPNAIVKSAEGESTDTIKPAAIPNTNDAVVKETANTTTPRMDYTLWHQAEKLEQQGQYSEASKSYIKLYNELRSKNADLDEQLSCLNRFDSCMQKAKKSGQAINPIAIPSNSNRSTGTLQTPVSSPPPLRSDFPTTRANSISQSDPPNSGTNRNLQSTGPGRLRRSGFSIDNKTTYALEDEKGNLKFYVTEEPGVNIETYVNRLVELFGTIQTRGDIRGYQYMTVSKINAIR